MTLSPMIKKILIGSITLTALSVGIIGYAHTKSGRFLLPYIPGMGSSCPVGASLPLDKLDQTKDQILLKLLEGNPSTSNLSFLQFDLSKTTKTEVLAWIKEKNLQHDIQEKKNQIRVSDIKPSDIPGNALFQSNINEITFIFSSKQDLISVIINKTFTQASEISTYVQARKAEFVQRYAGVKAFSEKGNASVESFANKLAQQTIEYRFANARVSLTAYQFKSDQYNLNEYIQRPSVIQ